MNLIITIPQDMAKFYQQIDLAQLMKLNFIIEQYAQGTITTKMASDWANLSEVEFLALCQKQGISRQTYESGEELEEEFAMLTKIFALKNSTSRPFI